MGVSLHAMRFVGLVGLYSEIKRFDNRWIGYIEETYEVESWTLHDSSTKCMHTLIHWIYVSNEQIEDIASNGRAFTV